MSTASILFLIYLAMLPAAAQSQSYPSLPPVQLSTASNQFNIRFRWATETQASGEEPHAAILFPVTLPGSSKTFYMQFDTGSPYSMFYKNSLDDIRKKYPRVNLSVDSSGKLINYRFKLQHTEMLAKEMIIRAGEGQAIKKGKNELNIIGTIGTDLIDNKICIIDYPGRKVTVANEMPTKYSQTATTGFMYANRSMLFPAMIRGKKTILFFDSGSSAYELLTDKKTSLSLSVKDTVHTQAASRSWDRVLTAHSYATADSITIAGTSIPLLHATYIEGASTSQVEQMMKMGIGGMTGNKLFIHSILVVDTKNKTFGLR
ncbi:MAG: hypothetical protein JWQ27_3125 [Ferruginibacter sp.]|nr:hypothetical protein [Ferruginibacter sp.]